MQRFTRDKKSTGKILFYSDFRSDAGSEAFELMLKCNGYSMKISNWWGELLSEPLAEAVFIEWSFIDFNLFSEIS